MSHMASFRQLMNCPPLSQRWTNRTQAQHSARTISDFGICKNFAMRSRVMGNEQGLIRRNKVVMVALLFIELTRQFSSSSKSGAVRTRSRPASLQKRTSNSAMGMKRLRTLRWSWASVLLWNLATVQRLRSGRRRTIAQGRLKSSGCSMRWQVLTILLSQARTDLFAFGFQAKPVTMLHRIVLLKEYKERRAVRIISALCVLVVSKNQ